MERTDSIRGEMEWEGKICQLQFLTAHGEALKAILYFLSVYTELKRGLTL